MALNAFGFETGSNGDTLTSANSGMNTAPGLSGGTGTISTAQAAHGTRSALLTATVTSGTCYIVESLSSTTTIGVRVYMRWSALPSANTGIVWLGNGSSQMLNLELTTAGLVRIRDDASANAWTSTAAMSTNTWYRVELFATQNSTTGTVRAAFYAGDSGTALDDSTLLTAQNTGSAAYTTLRIGPKTATGTNTGTVYLDDWGYDPSASGLVGPYGAPPTVDAGANQNVSAASTVNLSATANDSDGSISSYAWAFTYPTSGAPSLTGGTTATPSFTSGSAGALYILTCTVTDNDGFTAVDTVEIRVPVTGSTTSRPLVGNGTGVGTWTIGGGSATDGAALADASDATYVESPSISGTEQNRRVRWQPSATRTSGVIKQRLWTDTGTANTTVRLIEGTTTRQTWTQAITSTPNEYSFTLSGGTVSAISDWGNLYVELGVTT